MRGSLLIIVLVLTISYARAQQDPMASQYMFNGQFLNPAYSGTHQFSNITLLHRDQWTKMPGAPRTSLLSADAPLLNEKMGIGLLVGRDRIGITEQTDIFANYSYHVKLGAGKLSFGLRAGASNYACKTSDLVVWDENDRAYQNCTAVKWLPKAGYGMYYYTEKFYAGASIPSLIAYDKEKEFSLNIEKASTISRHYYLTSGYIIDAGENLKFRPSFLLKYQKAAPLQADLNLNVFIRKCFWIGGSYRTGDAFVSLIEFQINPSVRIGYAYDWTFSSLSRYAGSTHEFMLAFDLYKENIKVKSPRFF